MSHSCDRYTLRHHFGDKPAAVRALFDEYVAAVRAFGPFTIEPQKTRIAFLVRVRFAAGHPLQSGFRGHLWLTQAHPGPPVVRVEKLTPTCFLHHFLLKRSEDLNGSFRARIGMAYRVGCQDVGQTRSGA